MNLLQDKLLWGLLIIPIFIFSIVLIFNTNVENNTKLPNDFIFFTEDSDLSAQQKNMSSPYRDTYTSVELQQDNKVHVTRFTTVNNEQKTEDITNSNEIAELGYKFYIYSVDKADEINFDKVSTYQFIPADRDTFYYINTYSTSPFSFFFVNDPVKRVTLENNTTGFKKQLNFVIDGYKQPQFLGWVK